mgnify:CR=1 FL=1
MKKYIELELDIKSVSEIDVITTSPYDRDLETPEMPFDDDMLGGS